jgi:glutathione S-transferase
MKLYGNPHSTCTRKVLTTLAETNTPYEFVAVDFAKGEHKAPAHLAHQPFGQVPALEDNGFEMFESRAMCRYINEKVGGNLVPESIEGRARMEQWMSVETSNVTPPIMKFVYHHIFKREQPADVLEAATKSLDAAFTILDAHLAKHPYFAGDTFSLADICYMPYFEYAMPTPVKAQLANYPHLAAWWGKVSERPSWLKVAGRA